MSADRQRLTSAIRRIAKTDPEIRGLLDAANNKGGKPGAAGVGGGQGEGKEDRICCDGTEGEPNPGVDERDPDGGVDERDPDGGVDERDLDGGDQDGLNPDDPSDLGDLDGGCLTGVTSCDTGEAVCFCGDGFIPPDGWDDPNSPGVSPSYEEGTFWLVFNFLNSPQGGTEDPTAGGAVAKQDADITTSGFYLGPRISDDVYSVCIDNLYQGDIDCDNDWRVRRLQCNGSSANFCNPDPEDYTETEWPSDGCVNLAIKGGKIVGSKFDPENDGSYSAPRDEIHLCDGANDMYLKPSADGGWKSINATREEGYLYSSKFEQIAHIDGAEYSDPTM